MAVYKQVQKQHLTLCGKLDTESKLFQIFLLATDTTLKNSSRLTEILKIIVIVIKCGDVENCVMHLPKPAYL